MEDNNLIWISSCETCLEIWILWEWDVQFFSRPENTDIIFWLYIYNNKGTKIFSNDPLSPLLSLSLAWFYKISSDANSHQFSLHLPEIINSIDSALNKHEQLMNHEIPIKTCLLRQVMHPRQRTHRYTSIEHKGTRHYNQNHENLLNDTSLLYIIPFALSYTYTYK